MLISPTWADVAGLPISKASHPSQADWADGHRIARLVPPPEAPRIPNLVGRVQPAPYVAGDAASGPHWVALVDRMVENVTSLQPPGLWADPRYQDFVEVEVGCAAWDSIDVIEGHPAHSLLTNRQPTAGFFALHTSHSLQSFHKL
jgi:hypothetical protein